MTQDAITADPMEEGGRNPKTVILAGALAVAVLGAGAFFFLSGSDDEVELTDAAAPTVTRTVGETDRAPFPAPAVTPDVMPAAATVVGGLNPFKVLYTAPVEKAESGSGGSGSGSSGSNSNGSGSDGSSSGSTGSEEPTIGSKPGSDGIVLPVAPASEPYVLELVSIAPVNGNQVRTTSWVVDGTPVTSVFVGQRFGSYGELVVLALGADEKGGETVLLQVGDAAPRRIAVGEKGSVL